MACNVHHLSHRMLLHHLHCSRHLRHSFLLHHLRGQSCLSNGMVLHSLSSCSGLCHHLLVDELRLPVNFLGLGCCPLCCDVLLQRLLLLMLTHTQ